MTAVQPSDYAATLTAAKRLIQAARTRAVLATNAELIGVYWELGSEALLAGFGKDHRCRRPRRHVLLGLFLGQLEQLAN